MLTLGVPVVPEANQLEKPLVPITLAVVFTLVVVLVFTMSTLDIVPEEVYKDTAGAALFVT